MVMNPRRLSVAVAFGLVGILSGVSFGALAKAQGGSGYSGQLSSNKAIRKQQLICDPATTGGSDAAASKTGPLAQGAPRRGSTSVSYDPSIVHLSGVQLGTGYAGSGLVEVAVAGTARTRLQDLLSFLRKPSGRETGYAQLFYHHGTLAAGVSFPKDNLFGPKGEPGQMSVARGYTTFDKAGVKGFDTHDFFFDYRAGVPDKAVAEYTMFAAKGGRPSGNKPDSLTGVQNGREFTLGPGQLSSATVRASLIPLPPAAWAGSATLAGAGLLAALRRRIGRSGRRA